MNKEKTVKYEPKPEAFTLDDSKWGNPYGADKKQEEETDKKEE